MSTAPTRFTTVFINQLKRDLHLGFLAKSEWLNPVLFLVLVQSLFPLAIGSDKQVLSQLAPAVIWVSALLATLVSLESLFREDFEDGSLTQMFLLPTPFYVISFAKIVAHWLISGLPLLVVCPLLALTFYFPHDAIPTLVMSLLLATPSLCAISALMAALTLNAKRGGVLMSLLVLPLYVPILVFGAGAIERSIAGEPASGALYILAAIMSLSVTVIPFALSFALRMSVADS